MKDILKILLLLLSFTPIASLQAHSYQQENFEGIKSAQETYLIPDHNLLTNSVEWIPPLRDGLPINTLRKK
ncbi:hypothetical protein [Polaribacter sp.]|uniref:hypothetical protein n=1 Tax=Polaribacter sp. TaxID=1920175 RepID=UPI003EF60EAF